MLPQCLQFTDHTFKLKCRKVWNLITHTGTSYEIWKCGKVWKCFSGQEAVKHLQHDCFDPFKPDIITVILATGFLWGHTSAVELGTGLCIFQEEKYSKLYVCFYRSNAVQAFLLCRRAQGYCFYYLRYWLLH